MDGGHSTTRSIHHTYQHTSTNKYSSTSPHYRNTQESDQPRSNKSSRQIPRGSAPLASFDSATSIDSTTLQEERTIPVHQGKY